MRNRKAKRCITTCGTVPRPEVLLNADHAGYPQDGRRGGARRVAGSPTGAPRFSKRLCMAGAVGSTILFFMFMIAQVILGALVFAYAAHSLLVVVESTAAGNDEVDWPDDPILDWVWKLFYVVWLYGIWLLPIWIVVNAIKPRMLLESPGPTFIAVACATFCLLFPISLLSSLSATSAWVPFHWQLFRRLMRQPRSMLTYYAVSALLLAGTGWLLSAALFSNSFFLVPVAAMVAAAVFLIEARLMGRIAWLASRTKLGARKHSLPKKLRRIASKAEVKDPWNAPASGPDPAPADERPIILPGEDEPVEAYGLAAAGPPPVTQIQAHEPPPVEAVPLMEEPRRNRSQSQTLPGQKRPKNDDEEPVRSPPALADHLDERPPPPPPPRYPLLSGVYSFPWYSTTLKAWVWLSLGGFVEGSLFRLMMQFRPPV